jgi:hypothetical protein
LPWLMVIFNSTIPRIFNHDITNSYHVSVPYAVDQNALRNTAYHTLNQPYPNTAREAESKHFAEISSPIKYTLLYKSTLLYTYTYYRAFYHHNIIPPNWNAAMHPTDCPIGPLTSQSMETTFTYF